MQTVPIWWTTVLQVVSLIVSLLAIVTFLRSGQKVKIEQAEAMQELAHSIKAIADAQQRTEGTVATALEESKKEHATIWKRIDEVREKQTTLCALHTVNHPGQAL